MFMIDVYEKQKKKYGNNNICVFDIREHAFFSICVFF